MLTPVMTKPVTVGRRSTPPVIGGRAAIETILQTASSGYLLKTFMVFVLLPTLVGFIYIAFFQTRQYVSESRFVIRSAIDSKGQSAGSDTLSFLSKLGGIGGAKSTSQDGFIVTDYVRGRTVVADIGGKDYLNKIYGKSSIDYLSRLAGDASFEDTWKYWNRRVSATLETISGVVTLQVRAFSPEEALQLNQGILHLSENLINALSDRSRSDSVRRAENEVQISRQKLVDAKKRLLEFRNKNVLIDPVVKATSIGDLIGKLKIKRIEVENNFSALSGSLSKDSPSQRLLATQLGVIDQQIEDLKQQLTGSAESRRVSTEIGEFEQLKLNEMFSERMYQIAQLSFEKARQEAAKQQLFLVTIVKPLLPEEPLVPKVGIDTFLLFAAALVFWGIAMLFVASVTDHIE